MITLPVVARIAAPSPPAAPTPSATPSTVTLTTGERNMSFDAFYVDERNTALAKATHPVKSFYSIFTAFIGAPSYANARAMTTSRNFDNPLNDPAIATVLTQKFSELGTNAASTLMHFKEKRDYFIFVPKKLKDTFDARPTDNKPKARVSLFFGVGPENNLFGLRNYFAASDDCVLITIPGVEAAWAGYGRAWGIGITTAMITELMTAGGLQGIEFTVEVVAGYSTGYRGVNLTLINKLVNLSALKRVVYYDAFYNHDDFPQPPKSHAYHKKLTVWAVDTASAASAGVKTVIYAYTHPGGVPRKDGTSTPTGPLEALTKAHAANIQFLDFEFKFQGKEAIADALEKICHARLIQAAMDDYVEEKNVAADILALVKALPDRGSLGVMGRSGFTDLYAWIKAKPQSDALAGFSDTRAFKLITQHKLLDGWTTSDRFEFRHRDFIQEVGKESLLP